MATLDGLTATGIESSSRTTCSAVSLAADHLRSNARVLAHFSDSEYPSRSTSSSRRAEYSPSSRRRQTPFVSQADDQTGGPGQPRCAATGQIRREELQLRAFVSPCLYARAKSRPIPAHLYRSVSRPHPPWSFATVSRTPATNRPAARRAPLSGSRPTTCVRTHGLWRISAIRRPLAEHQLFSESRLLTEFPSPADALRLPS
jgi:hypothetical protein